MKAYVTTRWGQVHLRRNGEQGPTIILLHESPLSSRVYESVLPILGRDLVAIAVDTPGYGMSDGPPTDMEIADYAATIQEAIDTLGIDRYAVAGVHTGASLAIQLAVKSPDRVTHAVLSGVPIFPEDERAEYLASWAPEKSVVADGSHFGWAWERYEKIWSGPPELVHFGAMSLLQNLAGYHVGYRAAFRYDPEPDLSAVRCPVLLYTADRDLLIDSDRRAVDMFSQARLELVEGYEGQLPLRAPETYAKRVARFVLSGC